MLSLKVVKKALNSPSVPALSASIYAASPTPASKNHLTIVNEFKANANPIKYSNNVLNTIDGDVSRPVILVPKAITK